MYIYWLCRRDNGGGGGGRDRSLPLLRMDVALGIRRGTLWADSPSLRRLGLRAAAGSVSGDAE